MSVRAAPARRTDGRVLAAAALCVTASCAALLLRGAPLAASVRAPIGLALVYTIVLAASATIAREVPGPPGDVPRSGAGVAVPLGVGLLALVLARVAIAAVVSVTASAEAVALSLLAAVAEEALFRGAAFRLLQRGGTWTAVVGSAALFALVHVPAYGWPVFPVDFGAGLLFSWQRLASGRWSVPAATHAAANLLAVMR
jgi:membrane protease YdiL (CAAX protease family)